MRFRKWIDNPDEMGGLANLCVGISWFAVLVGLVVLGEKFAWVGWIADAGFWLWQCAYWAMGALLALCVAIACGREVYLAAQRVWNRLPHNRR